MLLATIALLAALFTPLRPDPWQPAVSLLSVDFWWRPLERNAFRRLPAYTAALRSIAVSADGKTALAVGDDGSILRSTDAGANWAPVTSGIRADLRSVAVSRDGKTALAVGDGGSILRSTDAGANWAPVTFGIRVRLFSVAVSPDGKTALAVGELGFITRSTDAGANWATVTSGIRADLESVAESPDGRTALAVGERGSILRSTDAGANWGPITSGMQANLDSVAVSPDGKTALTVGDGDPILRSTDAGANWAPVTSGQVDLRSVAVSPDGKTALAVGAGGSILRSPDAGAHWAPVTSGIQADLESVAVSPDGKTALAVGVDGSILRSTDAGANWAPVTSGIRVPLPSVAVSPGGKTALAVGEGGSILRSTDAGANWAQVTSGLQADFLSVAVSPDGKTALAVGAGGSILRSTDAGAHWAQVTSGIQAALLSVAVSPDGKTALAVGLGGSILRSTDAGANWRPLHDRRFPSPVSMLLLLAAVFTLLPAAVPVTPDVPPPRVIADLLVPERPLRTRDPDAGGTTGLAAQIGRFLANPQTLPPLTIAVNGAWGSGKSSVLTLLADTLRRDGGRPVWFNAWHHQGEESLFAALMQAIRDQAVPRWWKLSGLSVRLALLAGRFRKHWIIAPALLFGLAALATFFLEARWPSLEEWIGALKTLALSSKDAPLKEAIERALLGLSPALAVLLGGLLVAASLRDRLSSAGLDPGRLIQAAGRATRWQDLGVQLAFRARFKQALHEVTEALGPSRPLTILIDDLDRCRPDQIAEVMEALSFLTDADGCFVVMAYARRQVLAGMGLAHREMAAELNGGTDNPATRHAYAEDYLRKLVQIEVSVPVFREEAAKRLSNSYLDQSPKWRPPKPRRRGGAHRAWMLAVIPAAALLAVGLGMVAGQSAIRTLRTVWASAPVMEQAAVTPPVANPHPGPPAPVPPPPPPPPRPLPSESGTFYKGAPAMPPYWVGWLLLIWAVLGVGTLAWQRFRPKARAAQDTELFLKALGYWSDVAFAVRPSPREMKRFLNRLRFAAAGKPDDLPDDVLVGLAAISEAGHGTLIQAARAGGLDGLHAALRSPWADRDELRLSLRKKLSPDSLNESGLTDFAPSPARTNLFTALWESVRVES